MVKLSTLYSSNRMSKIHTKSRLGCQRCKQRKVKCDETKPACQKCASKGRPCLYVVPVSGSASSVATSSSSACSNLSPSDARSSAAPSPTRIHIADVSAYHLDSNTFGLPDIPLPPEGYDLLHMRLLDHLQKNLIVAAQVEQPDLHHMLQMAHDEGLHVPYLMDQMLALSSAHKSTVTEGEHQRLYRTESIKLQTRALSHVALNKEAVTRENSLALFAFSMFLAQNVLFDVFSSPTELSEVLNKLDHCFDLHQGIRVTAAQAWERLPLVAPLSDRSLPSSDPIAESPKGTECDELLQKLRSSDLSEISIETYVETVETLQSIFDSVRSKPDRVVPMVQEWLVLVPQNYIQFLKQRRPESIVVLAYYGALLHHARHSWVVGDSGRWLIQSISSHLGKYWADWLIWPQQVLDQP